MNLPNYYDRHTEDLICNIVLPEGKAAGHKYIDESDDVANKEYWHKWLSAM